jgi:thiol-disulfide isomerase/thioredoxin
MTVNGQPSETPRPASKRIAIVAAVLAVVAVAGAAGIYGMNGMTRNAGDPVCRASFDLAGKIAPFAKGEVAAVTPASKPLLVPDLTFKDASGAQKKLSDWRGKTVLLNLWATWCVPCRKEMPALDTLQSKLGGADFEVVAVNIDTRDLDKPKTFLKDTGIISLAYFSDEKAKVFQDLKLVGKAFGMPTSILIDKNGCEVGTLAGPAEWASEDAFKLVRAALGR